MQASASNSSNRESDSSVDRQNTEDTILLNAIQKCCVALPDESILPHKPNVLVWMIHVQPLQKVASPHFFNTAEIREVSKEQVAAFDDAIDEL